MYPGRLAQGQPPITAGRSHIVQGLTLWKIYIYIPVIKNGLSMLWGAKRPLRGGSRDRGDGQPRRDARKWGNAGIRI